MGLAAATSLSKQGWKVSIVDLNTEAGEAAASQLGGLFTQANITVYTELASAFARTWKEYGRLDFGECLPSSLRGRTLGQVKGEWSNVPIVQVFANAGILERTSFYAPQEFDASGVPPPPNLLATKVMFDGALMTVYLGMHFLRKNDVPGGSIIILASSAGIYPAPNGPLYTASKHGVVGLTRAMSGRLWESDRIHISCICPGSVETGLVSLLEVQCLAKAAHYKRKLCTRRPSFARSRQLLVKFASTAPATCFYQSSLLRCRLYAQLWFTLLDEYKFPRDRGATTSPGFLRQSVYILHPFRKRLNKPRPEKPPIGPSIFPFPQSCSSDLPLT